MRFRAPRCRTRFRADVRCSPHRRPCRPRSNGTAAGAAEPHVGVALGGASPLRVWVGPVRRRLDYSLGTKTPLTWASWVLGQRSGTVRRGPAALLFALNDPARLDMVRRLAARGPLTVAPAGHRAGASWLRASIALTLFTNDFLRIPLPTLPSTRASIRPLTVLPSRTMTRFTLVARSGEGLKV